MGTCQADEAPITIKFPSERGGHDQSPLLTSEDLSNKGKAGVHLLGSEFFGCGTSE